MFSHSAAAVKVLLTFCSLFIHYSTIDSKVVNVPVVKVLLIRCSCKYTNEESFELIINFRIHNCKSNSKLKNVGRTFTTATCW